MGTMFACPHTWHWYFVCHHLLITHTLYLGNESSVMDHKQTLRTVLYSTPTVVWCRIQLARFASWWCLDRATCAHKCVFTWMRCVSPFAGTAARLKYWLARLVFVKTNNEKPQMQSFTLFIFQFIIEAITILPNGKMCIPSSTRRICKRQILLTVVDHSARWSRKNAASCVNRCEMQDTPSTRHSNAHCSCEPISQLCLSERRWKWKQITRLASHWLFDCQFVWSP